MTNQPQDLRGLKALVGIMAVLIIIGTTVVVGTVIHRLYARFTASPTPDTSAPAQAALQQPSSPAGLPPKAIALPSDEHVISIASAGAEIALLVTTPKGEKLLILNPDSGALRTALSSP